VHINSPAAEAEISALAVQGVVLKDAYFEQSISKGIWLNPKIYRSCFELNNGLKYMGMATR